MRTTIYIRKGNEQYWNDKPKHTRSEWVNRKLEEEQYPDDVEINEAKDDILKRLGSSG